MKHGKRFLSLALALVMVFSLTTGASAANTVTVSLNYGISVTYNGEPQDMADVNGNPVYPVLYGGTTYLPIRAVGNMLGIDVDWDGATQTVSLDMPENGRSAIPKIGSAAKGSGSKDIQATLSPNITVKYNGEAQTMRDVNGNRVYPLLYGGTTYLPIRAIANMLELDVDWDGATRTVVLTDDAETFAATGYTMTFEYDNGKSVDVRTNDTAALYAAVAENYLWLKEEYPETYYESGIKAIEKEVKAYQADNARIFGKSHIGNDYTEVDWSTADDGYILVKLSKLPENVSEAFACISYKNDKTDNWTSSDNYDRGSYKLTVGEWSSIRLDKENAEYRVEINPGIEIHFKTGTASDTDYYWTLSSEYINYAGAPNTCAKALEITKNCKTDAEKIAAVFNWVASNIKYDYNIISAEDAARATGEKQPTRNMDLDHILADKSGVCEHYAVLMAGMLRSLGIPCKFVGGSMYNKDHWGWHAWVAVKPPETGSLNMSALGAGKDGTWSGAKATGKFTESGWIRLDPTNGLRSPTTTSNDRNYQPNEYE